MPADLVTMIPEFFSRLSNIKQARRQLRKEFLETEVSIVEFLSSIDVVSQRLKDMKVNISSQQAKVVLVSGMSPDDFKGFIENILQGSLEAVGDKISDRIMSMIRELKGLSGAEREAKIQKIKEAAENDMVDLSSLYLREKVQSNLSDVGVDEKESEGIELNLEKLRKLRGSKPKPDAV